VPLVVTGAQNIRHAEIATLDCTQPDDEDLTPDEDGNDVVVPVCDKCYSAGGFGWGRDSTQIKI
jgi:hypothetical protein